MKDTKSGIEFYDGEELVRYDMEFTKFLVDLAKKFVKAAAGKKYFLGGGLVLDITYGELRRPHEDLDICPDEKDCEFWQEWFRG